MSEPAWTMMRRRVKAFELRDDDCSVEYFRSFLDCLPRDATIVGIRGEYFHHERIRFFVRSSYFPAHDPGEIPPVVLEERIRIPIKEHDGWFGWDERSEWRWCP